MAQAMASGLLSHNGGFIYSGLPGQYENLGGVGLVFYTKSQLKLHHGKSASPVNKCHMQRIICVYVCVSEKESCFFFKCFSQTLWS